MISITLHNKGKVFYIVSQVSQSKTFIIVENYVTVAAISQPKEYELWRQPFIACKRAEEKDYPIECRVE